MPQEESTDDVSAVLEGTDQAGAEAVVEDPLTDSKAGSADFKASLERFRHVSSKDDTTEDGTKGSGSRTTRKRDMKDVVGHGFGAPSPAKKQRQSSKYAPPSKYSHLSPLVDILEPDLIGVFVGFNPGVATATAGHAYAHPSNMFWKLLHSSGITDVRFRPEQDRDLPCLCSMGNTNLVERPSKDAGELSKQEMAAGTPILEDKIRTFRPEAVCIVGKSIWQAMWRWKYKREMRKDEFKYGWQDAKERRGKEGDWPGAWVFVATATSGLAANLKPHEKEAIWKPFGEWVQQRREERRTKEAATE